MENLEEMLAFCTARHAHLCPRQVLGVRIGVAGAARLGLETHRRDKRLLVIAETDGCFVDGLEAATGAACGHRTLRVEDYGKIAATFVDVLTGKAVRVAPRLDVRTRASDYAPDEKRHYFAQLRGYQLMPEEELLDVQEVRLSTPVEQIVGRPGVRTICSVCGEEIINGREVGVNGRVLCRACLGGAYYQAAGVPVGASGIVSLPAN